MSFLQTKLMPLAKELANKVLTAFQRGWSTYRSFPKRAQVGVAVVLVALLFGGHYLLGLLAPVDATGSTTPTVSLMSIGELSGTGSSIGIVGSVRSVTEASILSESGGTVKAISTSVGKTVGAGSVLASLDNASQRAFVLQAEGAYEAALAARQGVSPTDVAGSARNTYSSAYSSVDSILKNDVDLFYHGQGDTITDFAISSSPFDPNYFAPKRRELQQTMKLWASHLPTADSADPLTLLSEAETITRQANTLANDIATAATQYGSTATPAQLAALSVARSGLSAVQASITSAKQANKSQSTASTLGVDANVKIALGALRGAQANLEKTLIRTPIGGMVNFFPLHIGDYVTPLMHVATVAQNGALEIVASVSESTRGALVVGQKVKVEDKYPAIITSIAPALDPLTKQIEVHVGVTGETALIDGQSVRISLPGTATATTATSTGPLLLPLTTLKLTPSARVVFSISEDGRLVAHPVEIGDVRGDRIEVLTQLPTDLRIVTDARGLSEGQKVLVADTPTP